MLFNLRLAHVFTRNKLKFISELHSLPRLHTSDYHNLFHSDFFVVLSRLTQRHTHFVVFSSRSYRFGFSSSMDLAKHKFVLVFISIRGEIKTRPDATVCMRRMQIHCSMANISIFSIGESVCDI